MLEILGHRLFVMMDQLNGPRELEIGDRGRAMRNTYISTPHPDASFVRIFGQTQAAQVRLRINGAVLSTECTGMKEYGAHFVVLREKFCECVNPLNCTIS